MSGNGWLSIGFGWAGVNKRVISYLLILETHRVFVEELINVLYTPYWYW